MQNVKLSQLSLKLLKSDWLKSWTHLEDIGRFVVVFEQQDSLVQSREAVVGKLIADKVTGLQ